MFTIKYYKAVEIYIYIYILMFQAHKRKQEVNIIYDPNKN